VVRPATLELVLWLRGRIPRDSRLDAGATQSRVTKVTLLQPFTLVENITIC
jgi:hypothetical protein